MRRGPAVSLVALLAAALPAAGAQQVRTQSRPVTPANAESVFLRVQTSTADDVMRIVRELGTREERLVSELYAAPNESARRRLLEDLSQLTREKFTIMSIVEGRCAAEAGPQPAGYLGVHLLTSVDSVTREVRHTVVQSVDPGSPAQRAGVRAGDTLLTLGGRDVRRSLPDARGLLEPGNQLPVRVARGARTHEFVVTVVPRPEGFGKSCGEFERVLMPLRVASPGRFRFEATMRGEEPRAVGVGAGGAGGSIARMEEPRIIVFDGESATVAPWFAGAQFRALDDDWRTALGLKADVAGVFVNAVAPGSPTAQAGLRKGDVVTMVGASPAGSPTSLVRLLVLTERPETTLQVLRGGEKRTLVLRLP